MDAVHLVSAIPTLDTSAFATGDAMHAAAMQFDIGQFRDAGGCLLDMVLIADKAGQGGDIDLVLFDSTVADQVANSAFAPTDTEVFTAVAIVPVTTHSIFNTNVNSVSRASALGIPIKLLRTLSSQILYGFLVSRSNKTYAAASIKVTLGFRAAESQRR